jgi:CRP-like cAMP-binding protein
MTDEPSARDQLRDRLGGVPLFARCDPGDLRVIADRAEIRSVAAGTRLIAEGEAGDEFFVVLDGTAEVRRQGAVVQGLGPGDHFGELALLDPAPRSADIVATAEATVGVLSRARFRLVLSAVPGIAEELLAFLARRLRAAEQASPAPTA